MKCNICGKEMTPEENCGGDCVQCMAEAGDPDCIRQLGNRMSESNYTVSQPTQTVTIEASELDKVIEKFLEDWKNSPAELIPIVRNIYFDGVKRGIEKAGRKIISSGELTKRTE